MQCLHCRRSRFRTSHFGPVRSTMRQNWRKSSLKNYPNWSFSLCTIIRREWDRRQWRPLHNMPTCFARSKLELIEPQIATMSNFTIYACHHQSRKMRETFVNGQGFVFRIWHTREKQHNWCLWDSSRKRCSVSIYNLDRLVNGKIWTVLPRLLENKLSHFWHFPLFKFPLSSPTYEMRE